MLLLAGFACHRAFGEEPPFRFGLIADPQYADQESANARHYRDSLAKLAACASLLRPEKPAFVVQLGDLVDGGPPNLDRAAAAFRALSTTTYSVLGNHDFCAPRPVLLEKLGMPAAWYSFTRPGWRFIVLDSMALSAIGWPEGDPRRRAGEAHLETLRQQKARNAQTWNGGLGPEQREWLRAELAAALRARQRAVVFCHQPVLPESCRPEHLLWDHQETLAILESSPALAAWFNGHDHRGGYAPAKGVHYLTLPGMVEQEVGRTCKVVDVLPSRLVIRNASEPAGQALALKSE
jgi:manganese-dependent ADP-ribose/CDP-alcohol diphosphatase